MCEERERLIGYVYEECNLDERRTIEAHLESCHVCRNEIGGLRRARQELLAWEVPDQPPVWRPVAPAAAPSAWSVIPAWALTAAAGLLVMVGAAGGAMTYALMPHATAVAEAQPPASTTQVAASPTADLARLAEAERRIAALERAAATPVPAATLDMTELSKMKTTLNSVVRRTDDLEYAMAQTAVNTATVRNDQQRLRNSWAVIQTSLAGGPTVPGVGGAR